MEQLDNSEIESKPTPFHPHKMFKLKILFSTSAIWLLVKCAYGFGFGFRTITELLKNTKVTFLGMLTIHFKKIVDLIKYYHCIFVVVSWGRHSLTFSEWCVHGNQPIIDTGQQCSLQYISLDMESWTFQMKWPWTLNL